MHRHGLGETWHGLGGACARETDGLCKGLRHRGARWSVPRHDGQPHAASGEPFPTTAGARRRLDGDAEGELSAR